MVEIWSPEAKIVAERRLWIAVLRAQAELGVPVPDGVIADYERVIDDVNLASIAARERVTRHDVKARIEEFNALAGHEHVHKGMTSRDLTENVEQLQIRRRWSWCTPRGRRWRGLPTGPSIPRPRDGGPQPQRRRAGHHPRQAVRVRGPGDADRAAATVELIQRYPLRGIKGPMGTRRTCSTCSTATPTGSPSWSSGSPNFWDSQRFDQRRAGLPAIARPRRALGAGAGSARPSSLAHTIRLMAGTSSSPRGSRQARSARRRCRTR